MHPGTDRNSRSHALARARDRALRAAAIALALAFPAAALAADEVDPATPAPAETRAKAKVETTAAKPAGKSSRKASQNDSAPGSGFLRALEPLIRESKQKQRDRKDGPVHPVKGRVSYGDAQAAFGYARGRLHAGQDIFAPNGRDILAPVGATVVDGGNDGGRGNWVAIYQRGADRTFVFLHLNAPAMVSPGEHVKVGEQLGNVGCTGSCWGDHLHFEIREGKGPYGDPVNPMEFLERAD